MVSDKKTVGFTFGSRKASEGHLSRVPNVMGSWLNIGDKTTSADRKANTGHQNLGLTPVHV